VILRQSAEIIEGKTMTRWVLYLWIHLEFRLLDDVNVIADERIMIKDGSLFGIEEVI
jgi:hypothetical protein